MTERPKAHVEVELVFRAVIDIYRDDREGSPEEIAEQLWTDGAGDFADLLFAGERELDALHGLDRYLGKVDIDVEVSFSEFLDVYATTPADCDTCEFGDGQPACNDCTDDGKGGKPTGWTPPSDRPEPPTSIADADGEPVEIIDLPEPDPIDFDEKLRSSAQTSCRCVIPEYTEPRFLTLADLQTRDTMPDDIRGLACELYIKQRNQTSQIIGNLELAYRRGFAAGQTSEKPKLAGETKQEAQAFVDKSGFIATFNRGELVELLNKHFGTDGHDSEFTIFIHTTDDGRNVDFDKHSQLGARYVPKDQT